MDGSLTNPTDNDGDSAKKGTGSDIPMAVPVPFFAHPTLGEKGTGTNSPGNSSSNLNARGGEFEPVPFSPVPFSGDGVSVRRWFLFYVIFLAVSVLAIVLLWDHTGETWRDWTYAWQKFCGFLHWHSHPRPTWHECSESFQHAFNATAPAIKLLVAVVYLSMATTLTPLPTGWLVAGIATQGALAAQGASIANDVWSVTLIVGLAGAIGSTIANLNDYYFWTWLLRSRRLARVRNARWYAAAAKWFARSPFVLLTIFNLIPIPVDVVRLLAITYRYGRLKFAAANFIGRFARYAVIAFIAYELGQLGWIASVALLALAAVLGIVKALHSAWRRVRPAPTNV